MNQSAAATMLQMADDTHDAAGERASALVNPASGLANDYLNLFNEVVMLIEQLPTMPELIDDLMAWRPRSYQDYFSKSALPGSESALDAYARLDAKFRKRFEEVVSDLDRIATGGVVAIRRHYKMRADTDPQGLAALCDKTGASLREVLARATGIVNYGSAEADDNAQQRADRLLSIRLQALKDVEAFENRPRFG